MPLTPFDGANVYPACQNLLLAARALGYGGVMTMWHVLVDDELRALLDIPANTFIAATLALGRPEGSHGPVRRRPLGEIVYEDRWGEPRTVGGGPGRHPLRRRTAKTALNVLQARDCLHGEPAPGGCTCLTSRTRFDVRWRACGLLWSSPSRVPRSRD